MKIKTMRYVAGEKFGAVLECESCGHTVFNMDGVDIEHFCNTGILNLSCPRCGKTRREIYNLYKEE